jgi:hypothetical protein
MSTVSRRPSREEIQKRRREKKAEKQLRARQKAEGLLPPNKASMPKRTCRYKSVAEECGARQDATTEQIRVFRAKLPVLLPRLSRIKDPRNPRKIKHRHTLLMIYGILIFVFQMASRREANREMTRPMFMENLKLLFPELEGLPHHDTLMRLLATIEVGEIESALIELVRKLIRNKKFARFLVDNRYPIAIDGTQKAFKRLARRLKDAFGHLPIMVLLDGLYPNGPIMELCRKNKWDFMIVLQDKSLKSVREEYEGLKKLETKNYCNTTWGTRRQRFEWVNGIEYFYGPNERKRQLVHLVVCEESWQEIAKDSAEIVTKKSCHAWISSKPLCRQNLHERCNLGARHRWGIESGILVEKRHGYHYEHVFSYNWNAMKGYHYLMRLGRLINVLALYSERLIPMVRELGVQGFIRFVRETISGPWLDPVWVKRRLATPFQLRLL